MGSKTWARKGGQTGKSAPEEGCLGVHVAGGGLLQAYLKLVWLLFTKHLGDLPEEINASSYSYSGSKFPQVYLDTAKSAVYIASWFSSYFANLNFD